MRCRAIVAFATARGEIPAGTILNIPDHLLEKLHGKVEAISGSEKGDGSPNPTSPADLKPTFRAWLENDELRTTGVCDDLAAEIRNLTADNMLLQAKLLHLHCGRYFGAGWFALVGEWRERARQLYELEGYGLHDANYKAAEEMQLLCFGEELKLKSPDESGTGD